MTLPYMSAVENETINWKYLFMLTTLTLSAKMK